MKLIYEICFSVSFSSFKTKFVYDISLKSLYAVFQRECSRLRDNAPYVKLHLYKKTPVFEVEQLWK